MTVAPGGRCDPREMGGPLADSIPDRRGQASGTWHITAARPSGSPKEEQPLKDVRSHREPLWKIRKMQKI